MGNRKLGEKWLFPDSNPQCSCYRCYMDEGAWALPNLLKCNSCKWGPRISILSNLLDGSNGNPSLRSAGLRPAASKCIFLGHEIFHALAQPEEPDVL